MIKSFFPFRFLTTKHPSVESFLMLGWAALEGPEPRRVTCVAVKIPPLPYGPLSVAWVVEMMEIQLDWKSSSWMAPSWKSISSGEEKPPTGGEKESGNPPTKSP